MLFPRKEGFDSCRGRKVRGSFAEVALFVFRATNLRRLEILQDLENLKAMRKRQGSPIGTTHKKTNVQTKGPTIPSDRARCTLDGLRLRQLFSRDNDIKEREMDVLADGKVNKGVNPMPEGTPLRHGTPRRRRTLLAQEHQTRRMTLKRR